MNETPTPQDENQPSRQATHLDDLLKVQESAVDSLSQQLREAQRKAANTRLEIAFVKFGVKPGVVVNSKGILHRVTKVDPGSWHNRPWLEANPIKKDGTYGTAVRHLYDYWELA